MVSPSKGTAKPSPHKGRKLGVEGTSVAHKTEIKQEADEDEKKGWTPRRVEILLECLEVAKTSMTGNVEGRQFTPKMKQIATSVRRYSGHDFNDNQVKNYWARLKRLHGAFQKIMKQTGITCDPVAGLVHAEDQTWEEVLLPISYAEVKSIRKNGFPLFMRVDAIIGDTRATGSRKHPSCISPSGSDSSDDPVIEIRQEVDSGGNVDSMRSSGEKRKHVAYVQGGGPSGSKKKNQSTSVQMARSISDISDYIRMRSGTHQPTRESGGVVLSETELVQREKIRREELLKEAMQMRKVANLGVRESIKCMMLFNDPTKSDGWVDTFLAIPPEEWQEILSSMP